MPSSVRYDSRRDAAFAALVWSVVLVSGAASVLAGLEEPSAFVVSGSVTLLLAILMAWIWFRR